MSAEELAELVARRASGYLGDSSRDPRVIKALSRVDRADFLPPAELARAYLDQPLPIGGGQTCSQPSMVAFMLDLLDLAPGQRVLEVGSGSGWVAVLAAELVAPGGLVLACELDATLAGTLARRLEGRSDIQVVAGDGSTGLPERPPFDRILLSAGVRRYARSGSPGFDPELLLARLKPRGVLLFPEALGALTRITLDPGAPGGRRVDTWTGVRFVGLRGANA